MKNRKYMLIMLFILSFMLILPLNIKAASYSVYKVKYKCKVRTSASDKVSAIKNGNDDVTVYPNRDCVLCPSGTFQYISCYCLSEWR